MMKTRISIWVSLFLLLFHAGRLIAQPIQDTTQLWRIETIDGNNYIGQILDQDAEIILLRTEMLGDITIPKA